MDSTTLPTKNNLIRQKENLRLSKQGHDLLEKKKIILNLEKMKYIEKAKQTKEELIEALKSGHNSYIQAVIENGTDKLVDISNGISTKEVLDIKYKSIMGVEIPSIVYETQEVKSNYSLLDTSSSIDKTIIEFNRVKELLINYAELQNTIKRLEKSIEKVSKRSNALSDMVIPQTESNIKDIQDILEERDREEFTRLKVIKGKLQ
jgi:V/A-type H+-transporting ATPase subunit D